MDGKHITIRPPPYSGSVFFNYKHSFSVVLMALVDHDYKFLYCDVGCNGRISDGGVFRGCSLQESLEKKTADIPVPAALPGDERPVPYAIIGDEAFPLKEYLMKPYPHRHQSLEQRIFNYRLSRARRVVENAFGILANRFRVLLTHIALSPEKVEKIVMACCALHNFLRMESGDSYLSTLIDRENDSRELIPGAWREDPRLAQAALPRSTNLSVRAKEQRDYLCQYVNSTCGAVPWQWDKV